MKREELRQWFAEWLDDYYDELHAEDELTPEVAESVLAALRPISREQVEKVWMGEWKRTHSSDNFWTEVWVCSRCGLEDDNGDCFDFCPSCGAPMTDEAVEMVMERLEALYEQTKADLADAL